MLTRYAVLLDIDETLVYPWSDGTTPCPNPLWTGGGRDVWHNLLTYTKNIALKYNKVIHYGIATLQPHTNPDYPNLRGAANSGVILEDSAWLDKLNIPHTQRSNMGLQNLLDRNLIYFRGEVVEDYKKNKKNLAAIKAETILPAAQAQLSLSYQVEVKKENIILLDNEQANCQQAEHHGFSSLHAYDLCGDTKREYGDQVFNLGLIFTGLFGALGLPEEAQDELENYLERLQNQAPNTMQSSTHYVLAQTGMSSPSYASPSSSVVSSPNTATASHPQMTQAQQPSFVFNSKPS